MIDTMFGRKSFLEKGMIFDQKTDQIRYGAIISDFLFLQKTKEKQRKE